jgi:hypothetical protein
VVLPDYSHDSPAQPGWIGEDGKPVEGTKHIYDKIVAEKASSPANLPAISASAADVK